MIDMEQEVEIKWNNANRKWFVSKGYNFTNWGDTFYVKAKDLHDGSHYEIKFICDYCGSEIKQAYGVYQNGHNKYPKDACWHCGSAKASEMDRDKRIKRMKEKVLTKAQEKNYKIIYDWNQYNNQNDRIKYICPKHGEQEMSCANFIRGYGCPRCGDESCSNKKQLSQEEVINIIESVNNNKLLNPQDYAGNMKRNLLVQCSCGNTFYTSIVKYPKKYRCSKCAKSESVGENKIRRFLEEHDIPFTPQFKYSNCIDKKPLPFDFHLNNQDINIEFDGKQHFLPLYGENTLKYVQKHDAIKTKFCEENNIKLIRINYLEYKDIEKILTKELLTT